MRIILLAYVTLKDPLTSLPLCSTVNALSQQKSYELKWLSNHLLS